MIVLKANAYGHGLVEVAKYLDPRVDYIGVAVLEEGILLREMGVQTPILVLGGIWGNQIPAYIENDLTHARLQLERFNEVLRFYEKHSLPLPVRHMANSGAILQLPESYYDMVRPGILAYGVYPSPEAQRTVNVKPALAWKSRVVYFKVTKPGHPVSYGSTWQSDHNVRIVTVPVGYGDGYFRRMSDRAQVIIHGKKYPQVGRICMDQIMVNIEQDSASTGMRSSWSAKRRTASASPWSSWRNGLEPSRTRS